MRRILVIVAIALVASFGAAVMAEEDSASEQAAAVAPAKAIAPVKQAVANQGPVTCSSEVSDLEFIVGLKQDARLQSVANPPCPPVLTCGGGAQECGGNIPCGATLTRYDLGWDHCDDNGQPFECPVGETIHVDTGRCELCPCCSGVPFSCACPSDGCSGRSATAFYCQ